LGKEILFLLVLTKGKRGGVLKGNKEKDNDNNAAEEEQIHLPSRATHPIQKIKLPQGVPKTPATKHPSVASKRSDLLGQNQKRKPSKRKRRENIPPSEKNRPLLSKEGNL